MIYAEGARGQAWGTACIAYGTRSRAECPWSLREACHDYGLRGWASRRPEQQLASI